MIKTIFSIMGYTRKENFDRLLFEFTQLHNYYYSITKDKSLVVENIIQESENIKREVNK